MEIKKIRMYSFRNLHQVYYEAAPGLNVFLGSNAQGKTSFLEGIYLLSRPISFRPVKDAELVQYGASRYSLEASCRDAQESYKLTVQFDAEKGKKEYRYNEKRTRYKDCPKVRVVLFTPADLELVQGSPGKRRRFLDFVLCQLSSEYEKNFLDYQSLLQRRNLLLFRQQRESPGFAAVNALFLQAAVRILWSRMQLLQHLERWVAQIFPQIYPGNFAVQLRYALSFPLTAAPIAPELLSETLQQQLRLRAAQEEEKKTTCIGPHRDDFHIYLNQHLARTFASQGQQRSIAISLKLAEVKLFRHLTGQYPVFLLDEVLAELDHEKKQKLFHWLQNAEFQSFLTAVNLDGIADTKNSKINYFAEGYLREEP